MIKVVANWSKWIVISLIGLLLILSLCIAGLLFTHTGLNTLVWGAQKALPQLKINSTEGAIFPRFSLNDVQFKDDDLAINARFEQLTLAVDGRCFLTPAVCIDEISAKGGVFSMPKLPPSEPDPEPSKPVGKIVLPLPIQINRIHLSNMALNVLGNKVSWQNFDTSLEMFGSQVTIKPTILETLKVALAPAPEPVKTPKKDKKPTNIVLPEVKLPLNIQLDRFELSDFILEQKEPIKIQQLVIEAATQDSQIELKKLTLKMPQVDANLTSSVTLTGGYPLALDVKAKLKEGDLRDQTLHLVASGSVADLSLQAQLDGAVNAKLDGQLQPLNAQLPFNIQLTGVNTQWPLRGDSDYQVQVDNLRSKGSLKGYTFDVKGLLQGKEIPAVDLAVKGQGTLQQVDISSLIIKTLGGEIDGQLLANWQQPINWNTSLTLTDIQPGLQWPQAEGHISGFIDTSGSLTPQGGWQVNVPKLDIYGLLRERILDIEGQLQAEDKQGSGEIKLFTPGLSLSHGSNSLKASGKLDKQWQMDVKVDLPDFHQSLPDLKGKALGFIKLRGSQNEPKLDVDLQLDKTKWQDLASVESISLVGTVQPLPKPEADIKLKVKNVAYQDRVIKSIDLNFAGTEALHKLSLDVLSPIASTSLALSGRLQQKPSLVWQGELERMNISSKQGPWQINEPVKIKFDAKKQQANVSAHCWQQAKSSVCLTKDIKAGQSGEVNLAINQFNFKQLKKFFPEKMRVVGLVNGQLWAKWAPNKAPQAKVSINLPKGRFVQDLAQPVVFGWQSILLNADLANNQLNTDVKVAVVDNGNLEIKAKLPDVQAKDKQIEGQFDISKLNLKFLQPLLGEFNKFNADVNSSIKINGSLLHPELFGNFTIDNLLLHGNVSPVDINTGRIALNFKGYNANLDADIDTGDGVLQLDGNGDWADMDNWSSKLRVFADKLNVDVSDTIQMRVVPDMTLALSPGKAKIDGNINLPWGRILIEELPPSAVSVSKDQVIVTKNLKPIAEVNPIPFEVETNVNINIGDDFNLSAFGLKSNLEGSLNVTQKNQDPLINGEIKLVDGTYTSFGQDLEISEGKIIMNGPADTPYLSIKAIRNPDNTQDGVEAGVTVTGPASDPVLEIFSDPAMPQANALSYLLRGQDIDGESGGNAMTTALISLTLAKSGKVVGGIGKAFGVQDLQLDTAGSGDDSQVTVSGYILPGLQVKYGVGIFSSLGEFTVRYRLLQDLYLEVVSGLDNSVDLLYQFEFE